MGSAPRIEKKGRRIRLLLFFLLCGLGFGLPFGALADTLRLEAAGEIQVGRQPKQIGVTPDGKKAYTTDFGGKGITVVEMQTFRKLRRIESGGAPVEISFSADSRYAFITSFEPGALWKIDTATDQIVQTTKGHLYPKGVAVSPDGKEVLFSSWWWPKGYLTAVDPATGAITKRVRVGDRPRGIAFSPDGKWVYLCHFGEKGLKKGVGLGILDAKTLTMKALIDAGRNVRHVAVSPDGLHVYASLTGSSAIAVFSPKGRILRTIRVGNWPKSIAISKDGRWLFSANYQGRSLSVVDLRRGKEILRRSFPDRLSGLDLTPDQRYVLVTGWDTGRLWRFAIQR